MKSSARRWSFANRAGHRAIHDYAPAPASPFAAHEVSFQQCYQQETNMTSSRFTFLRLFSTFLIFALTISSLSSVAVSQTTTGTVRGTITTGGAPAANAQVQLRNPATGASRGATANEEGAYVLPGVQPARYEMTVRRIGSEPVTRIVVVQIGATQTQNFELSQAVAQLGTVVVEAAATAETRTSESGTN